MIANELQYRVTSSLAEGMARALVDFDDRPEAHPGTDPSMIPLLRAGIEGQLETLRREMARYDALKRGELRAEALASLGAVFFFGRRLVEGRIAAGLSETDLAHRTDLTPSEIEHYEATEYESASLLRMQAVAEALRVALGDTSVVPIDDASETAAVTRSSAVAPKSGASRRKKRSDPAAKHRRAGRR